MIEIFSQWEIETNNYERTRLNTAIGDGYTLFAVFPGWGVSGEGHNHGMLILHKSDPQPVNEPDQPCDDDTKPLNEPDYSLDGFNALVRSGDFVILDTETTGLKSGEICEISIIDADGNTLFNQLVKTKDPIPTSASTIHGITDDMVKDCPTWLDVQPGVRRILAGQNVVIYNATYDRKNMHQSDDVWSIPYVDYKAEATYWDAMEFYAEYYGDWNDWHKSYTWQKLSNAASQQGIEVKYAHRALGDCLMTLGVIKAMADGDDWKKRYNSPINHYPDGS